MPDAARNRILCVEEDRDTTALIAEELVDRGSEVSIAYNDQEGSLTILEDKPDLVLCDTACPSCPGSKAGTFNQDRPSLRAYPVRVTDRVGRRETFEF
jgi:CheY-like chemotaxis protein